MQVIEAGNELYGNVTAGGAIGAVVGGNLLSGHVQGGADIGAAGPESSPAELTRSAQSAV